MSLRVLTHLSHVPSEFGWGDQCWGNEKQANVANSDGQVVSQ